MRDTIVPLLLLLCVTLSVLLARRVCSQMVRTRKSNKKKAMPGGIIMTEVPVLILQANGLIIRAVEPFGHIFKVQSLEKDYDLDKIEVRRDKLGVPRSWQTSIPRYASSQS